MPKNAQTTAQLHSSIFAPALICTFDLVNSVKESLEMRNCGGDSPGSFWELEQEITQQLHVLPVFCTGLARGLGALR